MNKKRLTMTILCIFIVLAIIILLFALPKRENNNVIPPEIPETDYLQAVLLKAIYSDFAGNYISDSLFVLDESATKNLVTGAQFSEDALEYIKNIETNNSESEFTYTLYSEYNSKNGKLTLRLKETHTGYYNDFERIKGTYTLIVKDGEFTYETNDLLVSEPSYE